jgi:hypothetical protein
MEAVEQPDRLLPLGFARVSMHVGRIDVPAAHLGVAYERVTSPP